MGFIDPVMTTARDPMMMILQTIAICSPSSVMKGYEFFIV